MIEDYESAHLERAIDQFILDKGDRRIAAMHMGGIVIECRLKSLIFRNLPPLGRAWKTDNYDPGHSITNPGHHLLSALKRCPKLYTKATKDAKAKESKESKEENVFSWLETIQNPCGNFIQLRYSSHTVSDDDYSTWVTAYRNLIDWIEKNYRD